MALLGGLSGLAGEMKLTQARIDNLALVQGLMHFEVTGEDGFVLRTHFGTSPPPAEPCKVDRMHLQRRRPRQRRLCPGRNRA